jgi:nucleotide-binding universal stress UspA family protein
MSSFKHILFPIDFSKRCCAAVPFVEKMASHYHAKVTLISVAQPFYASGLAGAPIIEPHVLLKEVKSQLDASFAQDFANVEVDRVAALGDPATVIADYVGSHRIDLVMMPSHGYGPFRQLLLGSVTAKVLHDLDCPVWTTAHTEDDLDHGHLGLRKILCAVDGSPESTGLMRWAAALSKDVGATLRIIHVVPGMEAWPDRQMDLEFEVHMQSTARRSIEEMAASAGIDATIDVTIGSVADGVAKEATRYQADLLVIGRGVIRGTLGRLRTHSYGIIRLSPCPVMSVPQERIAVREAVSESLPSEHACPVA